MVDDPVVLKIEKLSLTAYKSFKNFTVRFGDNAFLIGPNNAGKSTLIESIRGTAAMLRWASIRRPEFTTRDKGDLVWAYRVRPDVLGIEIENLRHQFHGAEARLELELSNGSVVTAVWPELDDNGVPEEKPFFFVRKKGTLFRGGQPATWRENYFEIGIVPTLSPVNRREHILNADYVAQNLQTRRASQHFRNHVWEISERGEFDEYRDFLCSHLPEVVNLEISATDSDEPGEKDLDVYFTELGERIPKEICWAGDGIQIYVQILTHLWRLRDCPVVVLDEPDVFLHADLQRRLVGVLETLDGQSITATHSPEMLAEASSESVIWVDKSRRSAVRRPDASSLEDLSSRIGSQFNLRLASALRARVVLFVEGDDMKLVKIVAKKLDCPRIANELGLTTIALGGFDRWTGVEPFKWLVDKFLDRSVHVAVVLDRDYRSDTEVLDVERALDGVGVHGHVWRKKELENYLLNLPLLQRVIGLEDSIDLPSILRAVCDDVLDSVQGQFVAAALASKGKVAAATVVSRVMSEVRKDSRDLSWCLDRLPAKDVLAGLNRELQGLGHKAVSFTRLARDIKISEIPDEFATLVRRVEALYLDTRR